ncbi:putative HAT dimerization domain, ribonuclease H-like domain, hAT-like transposase, RNase-H [Rosa chinensis]|uniref:Putative HAT dimerization domain, ribonuclease H-like domain, hAT-like transposase, RNase-H n=1 Tax=Rosa chinensis TaxID=74649 RepID=A0A2P6QZD1_ROSCH|nr:zinc finger BED domain-containing protein RICESLEEPER 1 [Rosa chinensis]PRQ39545.1 putative HAT dimerization domain, ribonuclease H-like domain, hAT-like transposase, RNase-H [Rosa chinensis]
MSRVPLSDAEAAEQEERFQRALAEYIADPDTPPNLLEGVGFRRFLEVLNPRFKPNFKEVGSEFCKIYKERKAGVKEFLGKFDGMISLSVEILRHENPSKGFCADDYLCLSAHFVDEKWKLQKWVLHSRGLMLKEDLGPSTVLYDDDDWGVFMWLEEFGIEKKISTLAMINDDVGYDQLAGCVKNHVQERKGIQLNDQLFRVYCFEEMIATMVQGAFNKIKKIIDKLSFLCGFVSITPVWNVTNFHLKEALELWSAGEYSSVDTDVVPTPEEWKKVEGVCKIVDSIYEVSNALFQAKHLTANVYLYHLHELHEILTQASVDSDSFVNTVVKGMLKAFDRYWDKMFMLLGISAALDPRFKMKYVEFASSKVKGVDGSSQASAVLGAIDKLFDEYALRVSEKVNCTSESSASVSDSEGATPRHVNHTFSVLQDYEKFTQLKGYLEEAVLPWSKDFDVLAWWSTAGTKYPILCKIARDFLAIPVMLATSHQAFSTGPRPADKNMVHMKPNTLHAFMCARSWSPRQ